MLVALRETRPRPAGNERLASLRVVLADRAFVVFVGVVFVLTSLFVVGWTTLALDMTRLGDALLKVTGAVRVNYAILGNLDPALHAHVFPRYTDEPENMRILQPWAYDWEAAPPFDRAAYQDLAEGVRRELTRMGVTKPMRFDPGANTGEPAKS